MRIRWSADAASDLESVAEFYFTRIPERAPSILQTIYESPQKLISFPERGRRGRKEGTREFVLAPLPFILVYQLGPESIDIVRILHGAQNWP